jgi:transcription antitermination factor NusG
MLDGELQMAVSAPHALMVRDQECGRYSAPQWHVVQTEPGAEYLASQSILELGFQRFLPLVRVAHPATPKRPRRTELLPAFRGYVFALWSADERWQNIKRARGVAGILHQLGNPERPAPVSKRFMEGLLAVASPLGVLEDARSDLDILPPLKPGTEVVVTLGPLAGWRGICEMSGEQRIAILLADVQKRVKLPRGHVEAV